MDGDPSTDTRAAAAYIVGSFSSETKFLSPSGLSSTPAKDRFPLMDDDPCIDTRTAAAHIVGIFSSETKFLSPSGLSSTPAKRAISPCGLLVSFVFQ
jgi:hypothetical protein